MSEAFANSGWQEKKLWQPPPAEEAYKAGATGGPGANGPRSRLRGDGPGTGGIAGGFGANGGPRPDEHGDSIKDVAEPQLEGKLIDGDSEPSRPPRKPKKPKVPKGPLEALDPDSSSGSSGEEGDEDEEDEDAEGGSEGDMMPAEYAVLDLTVPRTALVINVSHVLKRLNGCCSLNQLTKAIKMFKEKSGVSLEAFLRANPMSFKLEGRIVHLLDHGEKWTPPVQAEGHASAGGKGGKRERGGGKGGKSLAAGGKGDKDKAGGKGDKAGGKGGGKGEKAGGKGGDKGEKAGGKSGGKSGVKAEAKNRQGKGGQREEYDYDYNSGGYKGGQLQGQGHGQQWQEESWESTGDTGGTAAPRRRRGGGGGAGGESKEAYDKGWNANETWNSKETWNAKGDKWSSSGWEAGW